MNSAFFSLRGKRVWVAGHRGMVGAAMVRRLETTGCELVYADRHLVDLRNQARVQHWMRDSRPEVVVIAAAKVGGIAANNNYPGEFLYDNLMIQSNILESSRKFAVEKTLLLGSSCIYPKFSKQPIAEEELLTGALEPTNQWYAVAKIAGIKLAQAYRLQYGMDIISAQPTNLYGPGDNFDLSSSHVIPALIRKAHEASLTKMKRLDVWGTGTALREFMHVEDLADALTFLLENYTSSVPINVGSGREVTIAELCRIILNENKLDLSLRFDDTKPDGTPRKLLDSTRLDALGWKPGISLEQGVRETYQWYEANLGTNSR